MTPPARPRSAPRLLAAACAVALAGAVAVPTASGAATSGALTLTDRSAEPFQPEAVAGKYPSVLAADPDATPQDLWDGGTFTFPEVAAADAPRPDVYPVATATVDAPTDLPCTDGLTTLDLSFDVELNGPTAGVGGTAAAGFFTGSTPVGSVAGLPPAGPPVGWTGTVTASVTVPTQDLLDGDLGFYAAFEGYHVGPKSWDTDGFTLSYTAVCPPAAVDDETSTEPGTPVTLDPLANDSADEGGTLLGSTVRLLDADGEAVTELTTADGTYVVDPATGEVTFTPVDGFTGTAGPVSYRVSDDRDLTAVAEITVLVEPVDAGPGDPGDGGGDGDGPGDGDGDGPADGGDPVDGGTDGDTEGDEGDEGDEGAGAALPDTGADASLLWLLAGGAAALAAGASVLARRSRASA